MTLATSFVESDSPSIEHTCTSSTMSMNPAPTTQTSLLWLSSRWTGTVLNLQQQHSKDSLLLHSLTLPYIEMENCLRDPCYETGAQVCSGVKVGRALQIL